MEHGFFSNFMPHGHCYFWRPDILWTTVIADSLIVLAYFSIPVALLILVKRHPELKFNHILVLFAVFIFGCGLTHAISIWNIWHGDYGVQAIMKGITAIASVLTAIIVWKLLPVACRIHGPEGLERKNREMRALFNEEKRELIGINDELSSDVERLIDELQKHNRIIEDKNRELEEREIKLMQSNEELQQFAYIASHDLRSPLRNIAGFVQLLSNKYGEQLDDKAREWIARTVNSAEMMQTLIEDLLTFSRVETQGNKFSELSLTGALSDAIESLDFELREKKVKVTNTEMPVVMADRPQMVQLFSNLIGNAVKYGRDDGTAMVHISAEETDRQWQIHVADNGIGIDAEHHKKIFEIFQRLHTNQEYPGTGIGLAVCQRVVRRHGGEITVNSTPGQGSTFTIHLPKQESYDAAA